MCAVTKQKTYKHPVVSRALRDATSGSDVHPKDKERFVQEAFGTERLRIFSACSVRSRFSAAACQRDGKAANPEPMVRFKTARWHPVCFTAQPLNSPEISAPTLLFTFCVTLLRFGFYRLKPRVLEPRKEAEDLRSGGGGCFLPRP